MSVESNNEGLEFDVKECRVASVVVYADRAEVCREVPVELKEGNNDVVLKNLSQYIDQDSVRVEGRGAASITEVAYSETRIAAETNEATEQKIAELHKKLKELAEKTEALSKEDQRCEKQRAVIDGLADKTKDPLRDQHGKEGINPLSKESLDGLSAFLKLYADQAAALDERRFAIKREINEIDRENNAIYSNLSRIGAVNGDPYKRQVSIALNASEAGKAVLFVSYIVSRASWSPKYDMRVSSKDLKLKIMYYGMIEQSTGEDWNDAQVSLSTATPSVGGEVPSLGTEKVSFKREVQYVHADKAILRGARPKMAVLAGAPPPPPPAAAPLMMAQDMMMMAVPETKVTSGVLSATFDISRPASVPSDGTGHKVTVAVIDLKPTFEHVTIPKKAARVFMKARVKNESPYVLLAGPTNIFLDDNFVAKARINSVSPSEEFDCSLGVDNAVRVTYKPQRKFHEQTGMFTKSSCTTYMQEIQVKNTRETAVHLTVEENVPLSTDDKIKVNLIEPQALKEPAAKDSAAAAPVSLNKQNNVVWHVEIPAGKTHDLLLRYSIEHPKGETIEFTEEAPSMLH